jgi:hypothetical protein
MPWLRSSLRRSPTPCTKRRTASAWPRSTARRPITETGTVSGALRLTLLGAALLYSATGVVHLTEVAAALDGGVPAPLLPLARVGAVLLLAGLAFKMAAVPFHAWAPAAYDGAPVPVTVQAPTGLDRENVRERIAADMKCEMLDLHVGNERKPWAVFIGDIPLRQGVLVAAFVDLLLELHGSARDVSTSLHMIDPP